ncbi:glycolate oxidase subunit GlcE [uncultured Azohydromonas sp.]|jgi:FAD/FMN-containing dehydrogenases|uniref:glycolate oxidase subunit GlcE n=1 Tax=uncultured Azohydromonas sp. TaxID=487342 RepID=UPI00260ED6C2|nr:glycolate oxidase subunit GlcE [uncultured Azohydromonas sp.]
MNAMTDTPGAQDPVLTRLIDQVQTARAAKGAFEIRGHGSKRFYGEAPRGEVLDTRVLSGISSYEPTELVVTVRAGTPLEELEAALAAEGQYLPFEPPRFQGEGGRGTVGGMVAAGLAGPARATAGAVRDYVLGATILSGKAEVLSFGGQVMKNVAGYDVARMLAGSLGILGLICEVSLKVLPVPVATRTLRFQLDQETALRHLNLWGGQPLPLNASAWWDGTLVLRLSGARAAVDSACARLGGEVVDEESAAAFWLGLRDQRDDFFQFAVTSVAQGERALWRLSVPQTAAPLAELGGHQLVEWGGAQRWVLTDRDPVQVRQAAQRAGGHAVLYAANDKRVGVFAPLSPPLARIHRQLKAAFDPDRVFNPGRLYPDL